MSPLEVAALPALVFWLLLALDRSRSWPAECRLPVAGGGDLAEGAVVAIVPARDEAAVLPETLPSLLSQPELGRVLLVDDGSTDGTSEVAVEVARGVGAEERLQVVAAGTTPAGWTGKLYALERGIEEAEAGSEGPEWLLFTDADVRHRPGSVASLLAQAASPDGPYDLVSVMARLHAGTFWEKLLIPPFVFFFQLLYPFRRVARATSRVAAAAGGCVLLRRRLLVAAGGLESLKGAVIDDVTLARRVAAAGGRLWLGLDEGVVSRRVYRRLGEIWRMVARTAYVQLRLRVDLLLVALVGLVVVVVAPPWVLAAALYELSDGGTAPTVVRAAVWALGAWLLEARALWPSVRHHRVPAPYAFGLPLAGLLYGLMTWSSAWRHWRGAGAEWKGRRYDGAATPP